jgi:capsular exopolysaccharide synthesis family protein
MALALALTAAAAASFLPAKVYTAQIQFFVAARDGALDGSIGSAYTGGLFTQQRVKSYVNILTSARAASLVVNDLGLDLAPQKIADRVSASAPLDTVLINIQVSDPDPVLAQKLANSYGKTFPSLVDQLERPKGGGISPVSVTLVQPAQLPQVATSPRPKFYVALGLLIGLVGGIAGAVVREMFDTRVKTPQMAEMLIGAPILGAISFDADAAHRPLVAQGLHRSARGEEFRQIRTNLQFVDIEHALQSVVLTSSVPGEGKTTTACNLAMTIAQAGVRVVLVEGDLRRPRVAEYLGLEGAVGLTSVLLGETTLQESLQPWGDGMLSVLPSGPLPPNPSELLGSAGMADLLRQLVAQSGLVLVDSPPLLSVTDAAVLGALTSGVIMLVRSHSTRREEVERAAATVKAVRAEVLGTILNMVPTRGPDGYGYGYRGHKGYYAPTAASDRESEQQ